MMIEELIRSNIPNVTAAEVERFCTYYDMLTEWNEKMNLTTITSPEEVVCKHFADSLLPMSEIAEGAKCIDVGTGAGFPGVPLMIMRPDIKMVLADSLNKRLIFLNELLSKLNMEAETVHGRVEDIAHNPKYRECFDVSLTRAVARANILAEWTAPLIRVGGKTIMYKSATIEEEACEARNAFGILGLSPRIVSYDVPWGTRCVLIAKKSKATPNEYPRKAGVAKKKPM